MTSEIRRPRFASIVAVLALVVAMSGAAFAALQSGDALIAKRTLSGNRLRLNTVTGKEITNLVWHPLNLANGWENYNLTARPPAWAIDAQGIVHLRGAIDQASGSEDTFAQLPSSLSPSVTLYLATDMCAAAPGRIVIHPGGGMDAQPYGAIDDAQCFTNLDGVTWAR